MTTSTLTVTGIDSYKAIRDKLIEQFEALSKTVYIDSNGFASIGVGLNLNAAGNTELFLNEYLKILKQGDTVFKGDENYDTLLTKLRALTEHKYSSGGTLENTTLEEGQLIIQLNKVFSDTLFVAPKFEFASEDDARKFFVEFTLDTREDELDTLLKQVGVLDDQTAGVHDLPDSGERLALLSLYFNTPALFGPNLKKDLLINDKIDAWFQIRYDSNGDQSGGIAKRRYLESALFGVPQEGPAVVEFLTRNSNEKLNDIVDYEQRYWANAGNAVGDYDLKAPMFGSLKDRVYYQDIFKPIAASLVDHFIAGEGTDIPGNYFVFDGDVVLGFEGGNQIIDSRGKGGYSDSAGTHFDDRNDLLIATADKPNTLEGGLGNDFLIGAGDSDTLRGGENNDILISKDGNDTLYGGVGDDVLVGGGDDDTLFGEEGFDRYDFNGNFGKDEINDADHSGAVFIGGKVVGKLNEVSPNTYRNDSFSAILLDAHTIAITPIGLSANGTVTIKNWNDGDLYVFIVKEPDEPPVRRPDTPPPPPPPPPPIIISPLVLDLDGDGIETVGVEKGIYFDHGNDSFRELTGWVGADDGLLVFDRNRDGLINNGSELFGSNGIGSDGTSRNGFTSLSNFDSNVDNEITSADRYFNDLRVWRDQNQNGISEATELYSLDDLNISKISLAYASQTVVDANGNHHLQVGNYTKVDGTSHTVEDIWFKVDTSLRKEEWLPENAALNILPDAAGYGTVHSLHQAMVRDSTGSLARLVGRFGTLSTSEARQELTKDIIYAWTGQSAEGPPWAIFNIDPRKVSSILAFNGNPTQNPTSSGQNYNRYYEEQFQNLSDSIFYQLSAQTHLESFFDKIVWTNDPTLPEKMRADFSELLPFLIDYMEQNPLDAQDILVDLLHAVNGVNPYVLASADERGQQSAVFRAQLNDALEAYLNLPGSTGVSQQVRSMILAAVSSRLGSEEVVGTASEDLLFGFDKNDSVFGGLGNDILDGGSNDDFLSGEAGSDIYVFGRGYGIDRIDNLDNSSRIDSLLLQGLTANEVIISRQSDDLIINIIGAKDEIRVMGHFDQSGNNHRYIDLIRFQDESFINVGPENFANIESASQFITIGNDHIHGTTGNDNFNALEGNDELDGDAGDDTIDGAEGNDDLQGGSGNDLLLGQQGDDKIAGGSGDDSIIGGSGNDQLGGGSGNNVYFYNQNDGLDVIYTAGKNVGTTDTISFGLGILSQNILFRRLDNDLIIEIDSGINEIRVFNYFFESYLINGAPFVTRIHSIVFTDPASAVSIWSENNIDGFANASSAANDQLYGTAVSDSLFGLEGHDTIFGFDGDDTLYGGTGNDQLEGGDGADVLIGGEGDDVLSGGAGNDTLSGGAGNDVLRDFGGNNTFLANSDGSSDIIEGFFSTDNNVILFAEGITREDVTFQRIDSTYSTGYGDAEILIKVQDGSVTSTLKIKISSYELDIHINSRFLFADGTQLTWAEALSTLTESSVSENGGLWYGHFGQDIVTGSEVQDRLFGQGGDDILKGGNGDDHLWGGRGNDTIFGNDNDDYISGDEGNDTLFGGSGSDRIDGGEGDDLLDGGSGIDNLVGAAGSDTYLWGKGYGNDIIINLAVADGSPALDKLIFGAGVLQSDLKWWKESSSDSLKCQIKSTGEFLTIYRWFYGNEYKLGQILLSDGTPLDLQQIELDANAPFSSPGSEPGDPDGSGVNLLLDNLLLGGPSNDILFGDIGNDILVGGAGNDWLRGGSGNDILGGGEGDDQLEGGDGSDTYQFSIGDGHDSIVDTSILSEDRIVFGLDIAGSNLRWRQTGSNLVLSINSRDDTLTITDWFLSNDNKILNLETADGTKIDFSSIEKFTSRFYAPDTGGYLFGDEYDSQMFGNVANDMLYAGAGEDTVFGGDGADMLLGQDGSDILDGGSGNDFLQGDGGDDVYLIGSGEGKDTIYNQDDSPTRIDILSFKEGVAFSDLIFNRRNDNLLIRFSGTQDSILVYNYFLEDGLSSYRLDQIRFFDGMELDYESVKGLAPYGSVENDEIFLESTDDTVFGLEGDDVINGGAGNDFISGDNGVDRIYGGEGADTLVGGEGFDTLSGGAGNDTFRFSFGDGNDTIIDEATLGDVNRIEFASNILVSDVWFSIDGNSLFVGYGNDSIYISNYLSIAAVNNVSPFEFAFSDGTILDKWSIENILGIASENLISGTSSDDVITGDATNDKVLAGDGNDDVQGGRGNDSLFGDSGDDILDGGLDNDILDGGLGDDIYLFGVGGGFDVIANEDAGVNDHDILRFKDEVDPGAVRVYRVGDNLNFILTGNIDSISIANFFAPNAIWPTIHFADGTTWDKSFIDARLMEGTDAADDLDGTDMNDVISGGAGRDNIVGWAGNDTISGGDDDDSIFGHDDNDELSGDAGRDYILGGSGDDLIRGGTEGDSLFGDDGNDTLFGESGRDYLNGGAGSDVITGGDDGDTINGDDGDDHLSGDDGDDYVNGGAGNNVIDGGSGNDALFGGNDDDVILGNLGADFADGAAGADIISGGDGNDVLFGRDGDDELYGDDGDDELSGGSGDDLLIGGDGNDIYRWGRGDGNDQVSNNSNADQNNLSRNDRLIFSPYIVSSDLSWTRVEDDLVATLLDSGEQLTLSKWFIGFGNKLQHISLANGSNLDIAAIEASTVLVEPLAPPIIGSDSSDNISGDAEDNTISGLGGNDNLYGNGGNDTIYGDAGADQLSGGEGDDLLLGGADDDILQGDAGNDSLFGGSGNDELYGGSGDDELSGGVGEDTLIGGEGNDTYRWGRGVGNDTVLNGSVTDQNNTSRQDRLIFAEGISASDIIWTRSEDSLIATVNGDQLSFSDWFVGVDNKLQQILLADGTELSITSIEQDTRSIKGWEGSDYLLGTSADDLMFGLGGSDYLYGNEGDDTIYGGDDFDQLIGGDGHDQLFGGGHSDILQGDAGNDLLFGDEGNDSLYGDSGDDELSGGEGSDYLFGGEGNDTYRWGRGAGSDWIINNSQDDQNNLARNDKLIFTEGLSASDLSWTRDRDDLVATIRDSGDQLYIADWFFSGNKLKHILLADGTELDIADIEASTEPAPVIPPIVGTESSDNISGTSEDNIISGLGGNDNLNGNGGNDVIYGEAGIDQLNGGDGNDQLFGGADRDILQGNDGNDLLVGDAGNDDLSGGAGNDDLFGGTGDDNLSGDEGNDTYRWGRAVGTDWILNSSSADQNNPARNDRLIFAEGIGASDLSWTRSGNTLIATINDTGDQLYISDWFANAGNKLQQILLADGTELSIAAIEQETRSIKGTESSDYISGTSEDNIISGLGGNDNLNGNGGNDVIYGEAGIDQLNGGDGNDQLFGGADRDILQGNDGNDLLVGDAGNDELYGGSGDDDLSGGAGDDVLVGESGNDAYSFAVEGGTDWISDADSTVGNVDLIRFEAGIDVDELWFKRNGSDLEVSIVGTTDKLIVSSWYSGSTYHIEQFKTAGGQVLMSSQVDALVSAMAVFDAPTGVGAIIPQETYDQLQPVLAANWN